MKLAKRNTKKNKNLPPTAAMRQAGNPSSVDNLRIREMSVSKRTIPGKSPARRIAAERSHVYTNVVDLLRK